MAYIGDTVRLKCFFRTFSGKEINPVNVMLKIYDNQQQEIDSFNLDDTNKIDGVYFYDYVIPAGTGNLIYEFAGVYNDKPIVTRGELKRVWV